MSYPTIYDVSYSYTGFQAALGDGSFPGTQLDADMAGLSDSIASIEAFIQTAFRPDGVLKAASLPGTDPNVLDDYEEGAFTPVLVGSGNTFSFLMQAGRYTKIGRLVNFDLTIELNTSGNTLAANALTITGLPFTSGTTNAVFRVDWRNSTSSYIGVSAALSSGSTTLTLYGLTAAATSSYTAATGTTLLHATNGSRLRINGTYEAAA